MTSKRLVIFVALIACLVPSAIAFAPNKAVALTSAPKPTASSLYIFGSKNTKAQAPPLQEPKKTISGSRRKQLGIADNEDEYDLGMALDNNTDPFITKVIAGSFIVAVIALLVAGIIIPATTDYGDGVCRPLLTGGRC